MNQQLIVKSETSRRLLALDALRGLAVIGMYVQHFALNEWNNFVSGNTMILFILCSGISYSMMLQGMLHRGTTPQALRARVLARTVFIDFAGYLIPMFNGPFGVVLQAYAMLFVLALPLRKCSVKMLTVLSAAAFIVCPPLMLIGMSLFEGIALLSDIAGGPLSALAWLPVFMVGMIAGRLDLHKTITMTRLSIIGAGIMIPVKLFSLFLLPTIYDLFCNWLAHHSAVVAMPDPYAVWPKNTLPPMWQMLFLDAAQGGSAFELLIGTGGSLMLLALFLFLERNASALLSPFAKVGKVSLTLYCIQFLFAWILMLSNADPTSLAQFPMGDVVILICVLTIGQLLSLFKNGPLEWVIRQFECLFYSERRR